MRKINYKYYFHGKPVAHILFGSDYTLFQEKATKGGMSIKEAIDFVVEFRKNKNVRKAVKISQALRDRSSEPYSMMRKEKNFYVEGIARLEKTYKKKTGRDFPPPCPRPANSPKSLDLIYLTTRYGALKLAVLKLQKRAK